MGVVFDRANLRCTEYFLGLHTAPRNNMCNLFRDAFFSGYKYVFYGTHKIDYVHAYEDVAFGEGEAFAEYMKRTGK